MSDTKVQKSAVEELAELQLEIARIELETKKKTLVLAERDLQKFRDEQEEFKRNIAIRIESIRKNAEDRERHQKTCKHKTGGKNRPGFLNGDGQHGYSVNDQILPWGEAYRLCTRCQKEWHHPAWTVKKFVASHQPVTMTISEYKQLEAEYQVAMDWDTEMTPSESSQFRVPALDRIVVADHLAPA